MLDPNQEQLEAAAAEAETLVTAAWMSAATPGDVMYHTNDGNISGVIAQVVRDRLIEEFEQVKMRFCSHLIARQAQPVFMRSWLMERALCKRCIPVRIFAPIGSKCDYCREVPTGQLPDRRRNQLNIQGIVMGMITFHFALCTPCADEMTAELDNEGVVMKRVA